MSGIFDMGFGAKSAFIGGGGGGIGTFSIGIGGGGGGIGACAKKKTIQNVNQSNRKFKINEKLTAEVIALFVVIGGGRPGGVARSGVVLGKGGNG